MKKIKKMQIKLFTIPIHTDDVVLEEMNLFLRSHKVIDVRSECVINDGASFWTFCIRYVDGVSVSDSSRKAEKTDYKKVLPADAFERFSKMREIRKALSEKEAVPAYAIFTNEELAEIAKLENLTPAALKDINGIGKSKIEKYGEAICNINLSQDNEKGE